MPLCLILACIVIDKGEGSYCRSIQCTNTGSYQHGGLGLYLRVCCNVSNLGQSVTIRDSFNLRHIVCPKEQPKSCPSSSNENAEEPQSCQEILEANPKAVSGDYTIFYPNGTGYTVYCKMDTTDCGEGGWTRIAYINMTVGPARLELHVLMDLSLKTIITLTTVYVETISLVQDVYQYSSLLMV